MKAKVFSEVYAFMQYLMGLNFFSSCLCFSHLLGICFPRSTNLIPQCQPSTLAHPNVFPSKIFFDRYFSFLIHI